MELSLFNEKNFSYVYEDYSRFPGMAFTFNTEKRLLTKFVKMKNFVSDHYVLPMVLSALYYYGIVIFLQRFMENRPKFQLRNLLFFWNAGLALFSIMGTVRMMPEWIYMTTKYGLYQTVFDGRYYDDHRIFLWYYLFNFSKVVEFGDTLFIVLRKQRLIALHWIHHILTLIYTWYTMFELTCNARWLICMNFFVHSIMYTYFAIMASGRRVKPIYASIVTLIQIIQMIFGLITEAMILYIPNEHCHKPISYNIFGFVMYFLYFVMFSQLFIQKYICAKSDVKKKN